MFVIGMMAASPRQRPSSPATTSTPRATTATPAGPVYQPVARIYQGPDDAYEVRRMAVQLAPDAPEREMGIFSSEAFARDVAAKYDWRVEDK